MNVARRRAASGVATGTALGAAFGTAVGVALGAASGAAQPAGPAQPAALVSTRVRGQRLDPDGAVRVWNLVGAVRVTGWARDSVAVVARLADGGQFFFGGGPRGVKVGAEGRDGAAVPAVLEVRVPRGARVWVKTATAPVTVAGVTGEVELYSVGGAVRVDGRPAVLRAESLDGGVTAEGGAAYLRARTSSGAVRVRGAVDDAELATVGGPVELAGNVAGRARVETVTGRVRYAGALAAGATLDVDTHAGDVGLALAPRAGAAPALDLLSVRGRVGGAAVRGLVRARGAGQAVARAGSKEGGRVTVRSFRGAVTVEGPAAP